MGEMADYYQAQDEARDEVNGLAFDEHPHQDDIDNENVWLTNNGQAIPIKKLSPQHRQNIIRYIESGKPVGGQEYKLDNLKRTSHEE